MTTILLDINGTIAPTSSGDFKSAYVSEINSNINLDILDELKKLSSDYNINIIWFSSHNSDSLSINRIINVDWDYLNISKFVSPHDFWQKSGSLRNFISKNPDEKIIILDDSLKDTTFQAEVRSLAPLGQIKIIAPHYTTGITEHDIKNIKKLVMK